MTFGDLNPNGISAFDGAIGCFLLYKYFKLSNDTIKQHSTFLMTKFNIT